MNKGEDEGRGATAAFPGERDCTFSFVADSSSGPAALKNVALTPPPPGFNRLQRSFHLTKRKFEIWQVYLTENIVYTSFKRGTGAWEISKNNEIHVNQEADIDVN